VEDTEKKAKAKPVAKSTAVKQSAAKTSPATAEKPAAKAKKPAAATEKPVEVAPPAVKKAAAKKPAVAAVAAEKPAAKSKKTAATAAEVVATPAAKKPAAKKSVATAVAAEKPAAKSKKTAATAAEVVATPAAKKPAAQKSVATAVAAEKPATKAKRPSSLTPTAKQLAAQKAAETATAKPAKAKKVAATEVGAAKPAAKPKKAAVEAPAAPAVEEPTKKVRLKPRRRELKRQGLWVPKHERGKQATPAEELDVHQGSKGALSGKGKAPAEQAPKGKKPDAKGQNAPIANPQGKFAAKDEKRSKDGKGPGSKKGNKPPKVVPEAFTDFVKRPNTRLERKNDRKQERLDKAEREFDQSQGLFTEPIRLNRFVALSGICSRREADVLIQGGKVKVNGKTVREMGHKIMPGKDKVVYKDHELRIKVFVYLLMNKPKNRITTTEDELGRDTVMEVAERYTKARVYPVGRLDRNTTGLLLLTNDGDLTLKLTHPSSKFPKLYNARLDKDITDADILALRKGFELEDGFIKADKADRTSIEVGNEIGIEIHSGANHIVKRMLAHLGYEVITLDRVKLGPLNKKGLARGTCRFLSEKEVGFLKML
jgi:pseudouridine synthase